MKFLQSTVDNQGEFIISEHQQIQQSKNPEPSSQRRITFASQNHASNPAYIIQRARIDPKSLTSADVLQLQRTIGNRAVGRLLSEIRNASKVQQLPIQRQEIPEEEEPLQGKLMGTIQRQEIPEEEEPLQGMFEGKSKKETCPSCMQRQKISEEEEPLQGKMIGTVQRQEIPEDKESLQAKRKNNTGIPDNLKAGAESLSGIDMSDVRVHYNSSKPEEVGAFAYTQGINIHVAPGQERHLSHEAWHVVQQAQGKVRPTFQMKGVMVNDDEGLENEADVMGKKALMTGQELIAHKLTSVVQQKVGPVILSSQAEETNGKVITTTKAPTNDGMTGLIQRAIGLELEVAVPVDQLTDHEIDAIRVAAGNDPNHIPHMAPLQPLVQGGRTRAVLYSRDGIKATNGNYRVGIDHDSRVNSRKNPAFPYRDMNNSAIMEIITEPKDNKAAFDIAMNDVDAFVNDVNLRTNNLTEHAVNPYGGGSGANIGPIHYPALGHMPKEDNHNWKASVQVNIGVDMREYGSLAKWYAKSTYANPSKAEPHSSGDYNNAKENIMKAVDIGREVTEWLSEGCTKQQRAQMGNLRGLRGWITHMALYMLGGKGGLPQGSTAKNITPILMKSPKDIAIHYGMTAMEEAWYTHHDEATNQDDTRTAILAKLIEKTGRDDLDPAQPLIGSIVKQVPDEGSLDQLSANEGLTLYVGQSIPGEQAVGPARTGAVVPNTATGGRGGAVIEFRNLPGFYEPNQWRQLGYDFLREAESRNRRSGEKP